MGGFRQAIHVVGQVVFFHHGHAVGAVQPFAQIKVGAAHRTKWPGFFLCRFSADRAAHNVRAILSAGR